MLLLLQCWRELQLQTCNDIYTYVSGGLRISIEVHDMEIAMKLFIYVAEMKYFLRPELRHEMPPAGLQN